MRTPATADSPASSTTEARIRAVSRMPTRRSAATRAAGTQTAPGMYLARIDAISACSARKYGMRSPQARRMRCQAIVKSR